MVDKELLSKLRDECSRIEEDTEHSYKAHYNSSAAWSSVSLWLGLPAALLGAAATGLATIEGAQLCVMASSFVSTLLVTAILFVKPNEKSEAHKNAGNHYHALRNRTRSFREIDLISEDRPDKLRASVRWLAKRRDELNSSMPPISARAYEKAKKDIDAGQARYQVDKDSNSDR